MNILAIDVGATHIKSAVYANAEARAKASTKVFSMPTPKVFSMPTPKNRRVFLSSLEKIIFSQKGNFSGIAICFPGMIDAKSGKILNLPNMRFMNGFTIGAFLRKHTKNFKIDNDAKCYLRAEVAFGSAKKFKNAVLIALGSGIGGAIMTEGKIYFGQGSAGEVGHMVIDGGKTLEQLAAGRTALSHTAQDFARVRKYLGIGMANLVNILNPEIVIITGGFGQDQSKQFLTKAKEVMVKYIVDPRAKNVPVVVGKLGSEAALIGAVLLFK